MPSIFKHEPARKLTWERHPADLARLLASVGMFIVAVTLMAADPGGASSLAGSLIEIFALLPAPIRTGALGLVQIAAIVAPVVLVVGLALFRRTRLAGLVVAAGSLAASLSVVLGSTFSKSTPQQVDRAASTHSWLTGALFPSAPYLAGAAAVTTVLVPSLPRRWRRSAWLGLMALAVLRMMSAVTVPTHVATAVLFGLSVGSALLLLVGAPRRRLGVADLDRALLRAGIHTAGSIRIDESGAYRAQIAGVGRVRLHVLDRDDRDADLLYRTFTMAQRRGIENERITWSPEQVAAHEALVTLLASRAGVPVLEVHGVATTEEGAGIVVVCHDDERPLNSLEAHEVTDEVLGAAWDSVVALHEQRIAHGRLHMGHLYVDSSSQGQPVVRVGGLSRARLSASPDRMALDVAELLVSTSVAEGAREAVAATSSLSEAQLAAALPLLQPLALSHSTRQRVNRALKDQPELLEDLRAEVARVASVDGYEMAELKRITVGGVVSLVGSGVLVLVLTAFVSNWASIASAMSDANWVYLPGIMALVALTYPAGALSLKGAVTNALPLTQTSEVMLAQSFLNRFTPANVGGMALRARYLQNNGVELPVAASSVGLTSMASGLVQALFIVGFVLWAGSGGDTAFSLPDVSVIALAIAVLLAVGGLVWLTPLRRRVLDSKLLASAGQIWQNVKALSRSPGKMALLFGGAALGKMLIIVAFAQSCRALGIDLPFAQLGALYLTANTVASAAPTPGGIGAMEAALVAVLTGAQVDSATALSAVLVFRVVSFWLPVPFSWFALRHLRATQAV